MVTQSQYLNTISKTRTVLRKKGFWTRSDEEYFQRLENLVLTNSEFWNALRLIVDKYSLHKNGLILNDKSSASIRMFDKKLKSFIVDSNKFTNIFGDLLAECGFDKGIDSFGYPGMKPIADFKVVFHCLKCNKEWESRAVVKGMMEVNMKAIKSVSAAIQYTCPDCHSTKIERKLLLQLSIYPETRQDDIVKILKELPYSLFRNHLDQTKLFCQKNYNPKGWACIEKAKLILFGRGIKKTKTGHDRLNKLIQKSPDMVIPYGPKAPDETYNSLKTEYDNTILDVRKELPGSIKQALYRFKS